MRDHLVGEGKLFQPDVVLPSQYFNGNRGGVAQEPEYRLVLAVLEDAVHCFLKYRFSTDGPGRELFEDTREWIDSDDRQWPFSYENICAILGIDPDYVRDGLRQWETRSEAERRRVNVVSLPANDLPELQDSIAV
jgi:hypothetical protein